MADVAGVLVGDFDLVDLLTDLLTDLVRRCVDVLGASAAGVMVADTADELHVVASSSEAMRTLELFEVQAQEGPCLDCFVAGTPVEHQDLALAVDRWPRFAPRALEEGFSAVQALPLRLRNTTIGALNLFHASDRAMAPHDVDTAQTIENFVTIAIAQSRIAAERQLLNDQLNHALSSRVVIEQAKGMIAERSGIGMEQSFAVLRAYARNNNRRLAEVCGDVVSGRLPARALEG